MSGPIMATVVAVVWLLAALFLRRGTIAARRWPAVIVVTLAVVVTIVLVERSGYWPAGWRVR